jgi:hypothetical protein
MTSVRSYRALLWLTALCVALALPPSATADDGPEDARRSAECSRSSDIELRARADDDVIEVELEIETPRRGSTWAVILLHERRIAFRGNLRTRSNGSIELKRSVPDWFGVDVLVARASGPRGESCHVSVRL